MGFPRIRSCKAVCEPSCVDARNWIVVLWKNSKRLNCWDISPAPHLFFCLFSCCLFCICIFQPGFFGLNLVSQKHFTYWAIFPTLEARVFSKAILEGKIKAELNHRLHTYDDYTKDRNKRKHLHMWAIAQEHPLIKTGKKLSTLLINFHEPNESSCESVFCITHGWC